MDFTPLYPHSSSSSSTVSPNAKYILTAVADRLVLRATGSMEVVRSWKVDDGPLPRPPSQLGSRPTTQPSKPPRPIRQGAPDPGGGIPSFRSSAAALPASATDPRRPPALSSISFSPNSAFVLALLRQPTTSVIYVYSIEADSLAAQIKIGAEGVASGERAVRWGPSGDCLMVWSDWGLRVTVWSLSATQPKPVQLHHPKHGPSLGSAFSPTRRYFAMLCRQPGTFQDHVAIYDTASWSCVSLFALSPEMLDASHLSWSPCGRYLALVESALFDYRIEIWAPTGARLGVFTPHNKPTHSLNSSLNDSVPQPQPRGGAPQVSRTHSSAQEKEPPRRKDASQMAELDHEMDGYVGLGIRHIKWRPGGDYLAIGGWDGKVRILNDLTWTTICEIDLNESPATRVLSEPRDWIERTRGHGIIPFEAGSTSSLPAPLRPDFSKPSPTIGVKDIGWNAQGDLLACRNDAMPTLVYVFSFRSPSPSAPSAESAASHTSVPLRPRLASMLSFAAPVKSIQWHPSQPHLAVVCATSALYVWYPLQPGQLAALNSEPTDCCEGIGIPSRVPFNPVTASWIQDGSSLLVADKNAFSVAFVVSEDAEGHRREESMVIEGTGTYQEGS